MKPALIRKQHLALKIGIFATGIASAFEVNYKQIAYQSLLIFGFMLLEPALYGKFLFALRKILLFFTGYWLFATLFHQDFLYTLLFSARILYLILITVFCWGAVDKKQLLKQSSRYRQSRIGKSISLYLLSTLYFLQEYFRAFQSLGKSAEIGSIVDKALKAGQEVHANSEAIAQKASAALSESSEADTPETWANSIGLIFLIALIFLNSI